MFVSFHVRRNTLVTNDTDLKFGAHKNRPHLKTIFFFRFFEKGVQRALSLKKKLACHVDIRVSPSHGILLLLLFL